MGVDVGTTPNVSVGVTVGVLVGVLVGVFVGVSVGVGVGNKYVVLPTIVVDNKLVVIAVAVTE